MTIEISVFKLVSGVEADEFQVAACEATHHLQQFEGFHSRELYHDLETGQWTDVLHWESREDAIRASERVLEMDEFKPFIQKIDGSTVEMYHGEEVSVSV